jgi:signal transduction histidine kinase
MQTPDDLCVRADAHRLLQVFTNLLSNAIKFFTAGDAVVARAVAQGDCLRFAVTDKGRGIPNACSPSRGA